MASKKYTDADITKAVKESFSYREVCRKLGISDRGGSPEHIKKKINKLGLDTSHFTGKS